MLQQVHAVARAARIAELVHRIGLTHQQAAGPERFPQQRKQGAVQKEEAADQVVGLAAQIDDRRFEVELPALDRDAVFCRQELSLFQSYRRRIDRRDPESALGEPHRVAARADRPARPTPNPKDFRERYLGKLQKELSLSPEQLDQVKSILDQTGQRFHELREQFHDKMEPEFEAVRQMQRQRIMAVLTPEQQPKYQQILEEQRRRHEKDREKGGRR